MNPTRLAILVAALALAATPAAAQTVERPFGFTPASATRQLDAEAHVLGAITPALLDSIADLFTDVLEPHVAGSAAQARTRDVALALTRSVGLRSEAPAYEVFLPWPDSVAVEMIVGDTRTAIALGEPPLSDDPATTSQYPWANGYSGSGSAEADVVFVNYGLHEDYAALERMGVRVRGRVAIARYGRSFRGIKARLAEQHGAVALLMYSDPFDDGYHRGDTYPDGAWRAPHAAQRGSVMNGNGDPTTPGSASAGRVRRISADSAELPRIPVVPLSWEAARPILDAIAGADLPSQDWQGALPFRYRVGPGPVRVRVHVDDDRDRDPLKTIWNTIAFLPGSERPDEWVVVGAHRDAWGAGAYDNVSGTASVLSAARALAELARQGYAPRRTIVFATWDGEEWGLLGSTEWVEQLAEQLDARVVAYLNQDAVAAGPSFGAGATPSLERLLHEVTRAVPSPSDSTRSVYDDWRVETGPMAAENDEPGIGNLGGGSDYAGFYNHLGIASAGWGFGGGGTQYHSAYDTRVWMERFGDPGYTRHAASARITALAALRLANADILPFNYSGYATELRDLLRAVGAEAEHAGMDAAALEPVERAFREMEREAADFAMAREHWLSLRDRRRTEANEANRHLMRVERAMTRPEGLRGREWYRNVAFAADYDNGYATLAFPSLVEAIRSGDQALFWAEARDLAGRVAEASSHLRAARAVLRIEGEIVADFKLGTTFGFEIRMDFSAFVLLALILFSFSSDVFPGALPGLTDAAYVLIGAVAAVLFFASLLLHELGHAVVARAKGIHVLGITLFMFGGVARTSREASTPGAEFQIAGAGPLVSFLLAAGFWAVMHYGAALGFDASVQAVAGYLSALNFVLAIFNLLPGFPLDGGRLLRAILWKATGNLTTATRWATLAGQGVGFLLIGFGLYEALTGRPLSGVWLMLIGWFLRNAAVASWRQQVMIDRIGEAQRMLQQAREEAGLPGAIEIDATGRVRELPVSDPFMIPIDRLPEGFARSIESPSPVPVEPKPAATVVLARDGEAGLETRLLKRHRSSGFVPGAYVFPGGRVDEADSDDAALARFDGLPAPLRPVGEFWVAAVREAFEETGVLVGHRAADNAELAAWREKLMSDETALGAMLESLNLRLDLRRMIELAHWITPIAEPRRYDTRFFLAAPIGGAEVRIDEREMTDAVWLPPAEALRRFRAGKLPMVFPTVHTLEKLTEFRTATQALEALRGARVNPLLPKLVRKGDGATIELDSR